MKTLEWGGGGKPSDTHLPLSCINGSGRRGIFPNDFVLDVALIQIRKPLGVLEIASRGPNVGNTLRLSRGSGALILGEPVVRKNEGKKRHVSFF